MFVVAEQKLMFGIVSKALTKLGAGIGIASISIAFMDLIGHPSVVQGRSMEPTLNGTERRWWKRDIIWVCKMHRNPRKGDVCVFTYPRDMTRTHVKRVGEVAGGIVRIRDHNLFQIPENNLWMISDNPTNANDSNLYGPVNYGLLKGKATRIIWPPSRWGKL